MINCSECGAFISHDYSNLSQICDDCKESEAVTAKIARSNAIGMGLLKDDDDLEEVK